MKMSIEQLRESLLEQWNQGLIKGVTCPPTWNFNKFWYKFGQALYKLEEEKQEGLEDWQILERIKAEAKNEVHVINGQRLIKCYSRALKKNNSNYLLDLQNSIDEFADKFSEVAPLIASATNKVIKKREEEAELLKNWDNQAMNILLGKSNIIRKDDFFPTEDKFFKEEEKEGKPNLFEEAEKLIAEAQDLIRSKGIKLSENENLRTITDEIKQYMKEENYPGAIEKTKKLIEILNKPKEEVDKSAFLSNAFQTLNPTEKSRFLMSIAKRRLSKQGTQNLIPLEEGKVSLSPQQKKTKANFEKELQEFNNSAKELTPEESILMNQALDYEQKQNYSLAYHKLRQLKELHENLKDRKESESIAEKEHQKLLDLLN